MPTDWDWSIVIDRETCIGSGVCLVYAVETFEHDAEAKAVLRQPIGDDLETVRIAVEACPTKSLGIVERPGE